MKNLTDFLISLQTFDLRIINMETSDSIKENKTQYYGLKHESPYYSFTFTTQLGVMKDMAVIDLLALDEGRIRLELKQLDKVKDRFNTFWKNFHNNSPGYNGSYKNNFLHSIVFYNIFIVHNLQPDFDDITVTEEFVEDLSDSVKLREQVLKELITEIESVLKTNNEKDQKADMYIQKPVICIPAFTEGIAGAFYNILKSYFSVEDQDNLLVLFQNNTLPPKPLLFKGNGNQLADAFKQLFEANLIVGCNKADLEEWIASNFQYLYKNQHKSFTSGYLNGIISSDAKQCQSPVLDVKKQPDGRYNIVPAIRNKKNNRNQ